ncbi:pseudaminic acid cytidylyltransferase [Guyparkeria hydrothermalis]|uniref:pseudaminic acid cytidylyltransferase n=1 Tax=Guyparkeria TaxID=2035712 RepID=UPI0010ACEB69|nr:MULTISPECIES: pseudaminic acid cytidylyltransferase [Guyparkeria]MCL7751591.1 pseudaminic acid cytidylyltransferase [Guyparkeria hydrothermalis]TKA90471.1 pseudaminic acid cytidylyltransferase [Guyparkeria sp. SB14A]
MRVAVIPARGGSKRIPRKNIRPFCGRPMIAWSIEAALSSCCFDRVIVSTDDDEITAMAERHGAEVPFRRPQALADDYTGTVPVVAHAVEWLQENGSAPDAVCCLYATAPFVRATDLRRGQKALEQSGGDYAFSVTSYAFPIQRALRITDAGRVAMFQPEYATTRSQDLEEAWHDAGQFYWGRSEAWLANRAIMTADAVPVVLPRERVQDIDTPEDWRRAEWLFNAMQAESGEGR